ncbi:MAG: creatininase family protein [Phycisphaeraceae bacterium]
MPPRAHVLLEANYKQLLNDRPNVAVLPWGATEAHNYHLPHGTDVYEARLLAEHAAGEANRCGAKAIVLPAVPFGNDAQQLDQVATISIRTTTALAILTDVANSLKKQNIDRLVILNAHGGNEFKPLVRDLQAETGMLIVVVNFWQLVPEMVDEVFDDPGDHAGELETSLLMHLTPELVKPDQAGPGAMNAFELQALRQPGVWTPRPWSKTHPDTGAGDPSKATAEKGRRCFEAMSEKVAELLVEVSQANKGQLPYI